MATHKWYRAPLLVLALLAGGIHASVNDEELREVEDLIDQGKIQRALGRAEALIARDATDPRPLFLKARAHEKAGRVEKAVDIYQRLIERHPSSPEPFVNLSVIYASQERYENARELLLKALGTSPLYAKVYHNLVDLHSAMASRAYRSALSLAGASAKPSLTAESTMGSWSSSDARLAPDALASSSTPSDDVADQAVEPAPPISEPVRVSSRVLTIPINGKPAGGGPAGQASASLQETLVLDERKRLQETALAWAEAWSQRDVDKYLLFYSDRFVPDDGLSRRQWNRHRRLRIASKKSIDVALTDFRISLEGRRALVSFRQSYRSDTFQDVVKKQLTFERAADDWKIVRENIEQ